MRFFCHDFSIMTRTGGNRKPLRKQFRKVTRARTSEVRTCLIQEIPFHGNHYDHNTLHIQNDRKLVHNGRGGEGVRSVIQTRFQHPSPPDEFIRRAFSVAEPIRAGQLSELAADSENRPNYHSEGIFFVPPAALALHGHKKAGEAAHLSGWPAGATHSCNERRV